MTTAESSESGSTAPAALDGLRVLDLAGGTFGYAGKLMAGFGADVIKVEPLDGDPVRMDPPFFHDRVDPELSARHLHWNTGKRSVTLDLEQPRGQDLVRQLVSHCDVVIESFPPGYLADRGLGYDDLLQVRPNLVMASITHFGQDGPHAGYEGDEIVVYARGGYLMLTGDPDREPTKAYDELVLQQAALHAATAIMTGIFHREATGEGDHFDVAAVEAALFLLGGPAQTYFFNDTVAVRKGARLLTNEPRMFYPSTIRPCKDGFVHVHTATRHPDLLSVLMEEPGLLAPELVDEPMAHADEIDALMDRWLAKHDKFEVVRLSQELRIPNTEVLTPEELLESDHIASRNFFVDVEHPVAGVVRQSGAPGLVTETPWQTLRAPLLGEHTESVLTGLLELDQEALNGLERDGVITRPVAVETSSQRGSNA